MVTSSLGNHAIAMGFHARRLGIQCRLFLPTIANLQRVAQCKRLGVEVVLAGNSPPDVRPYMYNTAAFLVSAAMLFAASRAITSA